MLRRPSQLTERRRRLVSTPKVLHCSHSPVTSPFLLRLFLSETTGNPLHRSLKATNYKILSKSVSVLIWVGKSLNGAFLPAVEILTCRALLTFTSRTTGFPFRRSLLLTLTSSTYSALCLPQRKSNFRSYACRACHVKWTASQVALENHRAKFK